MKFSSPTSLLLNLGHAMDHWVLAIFLYTVSVIAGVWGTDWKELTPYAFGASFMFGAGSIVSGKLGDSWGRRSMMIIFFALSLFAWLALSWLAALLLGVPVVTDAARAGAITQSKIVIMTMLEMSFFGALTFRSAPGVAANLPTPWLGVWERINVLGFMLWQAALSIVLLRHENAPMIKTKTTERADSVV